MIKKTLTKPAQVVGDVPHAPVRPALLGREPRREDARAAGPAKALQHAVERPEGAEPGHPGAGAERDVDGRGRHEPSGERQPRRRAGAEDSGDEFGHAVGDREEGGEGPDLVLEVFEVFCLFCTDEKTGFFLERERDSVWATSSRALSKAKSARAETSHLRDVHPQSRVGDHDLYFF